MRQTDRAYPHPRDAGKTTMKAKRITLLCAALALALSGPALAAGEAGKGKVHRPARGEPRRPANEPLARPANDQDYQELSGQIVYQLLLAEVALQRGRVEFSSQAYADLAVRTRDPGIIARAIEIAGHARRLDRVIELARLWIQVQPDSQRAQQVLVGGLIMSNQLDGLAPELSRMLEADPASLPANLLALNRMFARSTDRQAVLQLISKVCAPYAGLAEAHYAIAVAAAAAGAHDRALDEVRQALELRPDWDAAAILEAQIRAQKSPADAIGSLQRFVDRNPNSREARLQLARALVGEKRYPEAKRQFEQLLGTDPNNPDVVFPVAILALQENDTALAEKQLKHLLTLDVPDRSAAYYYLGQIAEERRQDDEAVASYLKVGPGEHYLPAQLRSAAITARSGKLDEALRLLQEAATNNPELAVQLRIAEATLLRDARQTAAALELLDRELARQPDQPDLLYESALLAERLDRIEVMETRLRRLIALQPDSAQAYNALGYSYADRNVRLAEARQLIEKALQLAPDDPFILDSMGWVLYRQGDLDGALRHLQRALKQRPDPEIAAHTAEVLWTLGRRHEAQNVLDEARKKDPTSEILLEAAKKFAP